MSDRDRDRDRGRRGPLPTKSMMGGRIYIGKLPLDVEEKEIAKVFSKYGRISEVSLKGNYCFVQYESSRDSKDAVHEMNDRTAFGKRILVEHAHTPRQVRNAAPRRSGGGSRSGGHRRRSPRRRSPQTRSDHRLAITNLSTRCDERDLKAVMEKAGAVCFADAHRRRIGEGIVEFVSKEGMEKALKKLNGLEINGKPMKLEIKEPRKPRGSRSRSRSRSRTRSRSRSRSRSHSRSHSHSRSKSKRKRASSEHSKEHSEDDQRSDKIKVEKNLRKESKSDDEEFEEAERNAERRRSLSNNDVDVKKESDDEEFEEAERNVQKRKSHSKSMENAEMKREDSDDAEFEAAERNVKRRRQEVGSDTDSDNEHRKDNSDVKEEDEETEEVEEMVEEIIEEEVEVDEDDESCEEGSTLVNGGY